MIFGNYQQADYRIICNTYIGKHLGVRHNLRCSIYHLGYRCREL